MIDAHHKDSIEASMVTDSEYESDFRFASACPTSAGASYSLTRSENGQNPGNKHTWICTNVPEEPSGDFLRKRIKCGSPFGLAIPQSRVSSSTKGSTSIFFQVMDSEPKNCLFQDSDASKEDCLIKRPLEEIILECFKEIDRDRALVASKCSPTTVDNGSLHAFPRETFSVDMVSNDCSLDSACDHAQPELGPDCPNDPPPEEIANEFTGNLVSQQTDPKPFSGSLSEPTSFGDLLMQINRELLRYSNHDGLTEHVSECHDEDMGLLDGDCNYYGTFPSSYLKTSSPGLFHSDAIETTKENDCGKKGKARVDVVNWDQPSVCNGHNGQFLASQGIEAIHEEHCSGYSSDSGIGSDMHRYSEHCGDFEPNSTSLDYGHWSPSPSNISELTAGCFSFDCDSPLWENGHISRTTSSASTDGLWGFRFEDELESIEYAASLDEGESVEFLRHVYGRLTYGCESDSDLECCEFGSCWSDEPVHSFLDVQDTTTSTITSSQPKIDRRGQVSISIGPEMSTIASTGEGEKEEEQTLLGTFGIGLNCTCCC